MNVNASGGPHTWHIPYFLVPKEPELLSWEDTLKKRERRNSADEKARPQFLRAVSALLKRHEEFGNDLHQGKSFEEQMFGSPKFELVKRNPIERNGKVWRIGKIFYFAYIKIN